MAWKESLNVLKSLLANLYQENDTALNVAEQAGIYRQNIDATGSPLDTWHSILSEADDQGKVQNLVDVIGNQYPERRQELEQAIAAYMKEQNKSEPSGGTNGPTWLQMWWKKIVRVASLPLVILFITLVFSLWSDEIKAVVYLFFGETICKTITDQVPMYSGPGSAYVLVNENLSLNQQLTILGYSSVAYDPQKTNSQWFEVDANGKLGWINASDSLVSCPKYIETKLTPAAPPATPTPITPTPITPTPITPIPITPTPITPTPITPTPITPIPITPTDTPIPLAKIEVHPTQIAKGGPINITISTRNVAQIEIEPTPNLEGSGLYRDLSKIDSVELKDSPIEDGRYKLIVKDAAGNVVDEKFSDWVSVLVPTCELNSPNGIAVRPGPGTAFDPPLDHVLFSLKPIAKTNTTYEKNRTDKGRLWFKVRYKINAEEKIGWFAERCDPSDYSDPKDGSRVEDRNLCDSTQPLVNCFNTMHLPEVDSDPPSPICNPRKPSTNFRSAPEIEAGNVIKTLGKGSELLPLGTTESDGIVWLFAEAKLKEGEFREGWIVWMFGDKPNESFLECSNLEHNTPVPVKEWPPTPTATPSPSLTPATAK